MSSRQDRKKLAAELAVMQREQAAAEEMISACGHELSAKLTVGSDAEIEAVRVRMVAHFEAALDARIRMGKFLKRVSEQW